MRFQLALLAAFLAGSAVAAPYGRVDSDLMVSAVIYSRQVSLPYTSFVLGQAGSLWYRSSRCSKCRKLDSPRWSSRLHRSLGLCCSWSRKLYWDRCRSELIIFKFTCICANNSAKAAAKDAKKGKKGDKAAAAAGGAAANSTSNDAAGAAAAANSTSIGAAGAAAAANSTSIGAAGAAAANSTSTDVAGAAAVASESATSTDTAAASEGTLSAATQAANTAR